MAAATDTFAGAGAGAGVGRFRYLRDPVFLAAVTLYLCNRWLLKPLTAGEEAGSAGARFVHGYFADLLCVPFLLPPVLRLHRLLGLRRHDGAPTFQELLLHVAIWSA